MKFNNWLETRTGAIAENRFHRYAAIVFALVVLIQALVLAVRDEVVVVVPPTLTERSSIRQDGADGAMLEAWGLFVVTLMANVTPRTANGLDAEVGRYLTPSAYSGIRKAIAEQAKAIRDEQLSVSFSPTMVRFDDETGRVIVTGEVTTRGLRNTTERELKTYEMTFKVSHYRVLLDEISVYHGAFRRGATATPVGEQQSEEQADA